MKKKQHKKQLQLICPYCNAPAKLMTNKEFFGDDAREPDEKLYVCSNYYKGCDSYVTTYKNTEKPKGIMANGEVRNLRIRAHKAIDKVIDSGTMTKNQIYRYLGIYFGDREFHLGKSGIYKCNETIRLMNKILEKKN